MVDKLHSEDIGNVDEDFVLRVVDGRRRDVALHAANFLPGTCKKVAVLISADLWQAEKTVRTLRGSLMADAWIADLRRSAFIHPYAVHKTHL